MVIGVLSSGIFTGLFATIATLSFGLPLWVAILLYPIVGTAGAVAFISMTVTRGKRRISKLSPEFVAEYR